MIRCPVLAFHIFFFLKQKKRKQLCRKVGIRNVSGVLNTFCYSKLGCVLIRNEFQ